MSHSLRLGMIPAYLALCLVLGGASAAGIWANMGLQLLAISLVVWAILSNRTVPISTPARQLLGIAFLAIAVVAIQLIPLPPAVWTHLPGRRSVAAGLAMVGRPLPWMPLSLDPYATRASALWLLPAYAILLGIVRLGAFKATWLSWAIAAITIVSVAIGALQIAGGEQSPWYFYEITNFGSTTGFFSNANHMATLMVATIPFLAALYMSVIARGRSVQKSSGLFVVLAGTLGVLAVGLVINSSIAGIGLSVPVLAASVVMIVSRSRPLPRWTPVVIALLLIASVGAAFSAPFDNNLTGKRAQVQEDSRLNSFNKSIPEALRFMPVGSGLGTFQQLYRTREDPASVDRFYMNHVHGDYIEVALETGVPGLAVLLLFLAWWVRRTVSIWRVADKDYFACAATIASAAILAHSAVDYPLRTVAISALFAMCCALMAEPRPKVKEASAQKREARHLSAD